eukprot:2559740-Alexandrium_andersonii.AAC.1
MLSFGLAGAPLAGGRFAAALARCLQGVAFPSEARLQLYLDDPVWRLVGPRTCAGSSARCSSE